MRYLLRRKDLLLKLVYLTDETGFLAYYKENASDVLLLEKCLSGSIKEGQRTGPCLFLTEEETEDGILKYGPVSAILNHIDQAAGLNCLPQTTVSEELMKDLNVISIVSPQIEGYHTNLSYLLARRLTSKVRTLYLNFFPNEELSQLTNQANQKSISDLIYYLKQQVPDFSEKLKQEISAGNGLDYVNTMDNGLDLYEFGPKESVALLEGIRQLGRYGCVLVHLGLVTEGTMELLRQSQCILYLQDQQTCHRNLEVAKKQYEVLLPEKSGCMRELEIPAEVLLALRAGQTAASAPSLAEWLQRMDELIWEVMR